MQKGHKEKYRTADMLKPSIKKDTHTPNIEVQAWRQDR